MVPDSPFNVQPTRQARDRLNQHQVLFTKAVDGIREVGGFSDPEQWRFDWERSYTRDEWLDQMPTLGALTPATFEVPETLHRQLGIELSHGTSTPG